MLRTLSFQYSLKRSLSYWMKPMYVPPLYLSYKTRDSYWTWEMKSLSHHLLSSFHCLKS